MSTISDAVSKKRNEDDGAGRAPDTSADARGPRVVRVEVPRDHSARNMLLAGLVVALVLTGLFVGGYAILNRMGAFTPGPATGPASDTVTPPSHEGRQPGATTVDAAHVENDAKGQPGTTANESGPSSLPKLQGIFPDPVNPIAVINGRRVRPGQIVDGYTVKAIEDDRVILERDGQQYERLLEE